MNIELYMLNSVRYDTIYDKSIRNEEFIIQIQKYNKLIHTSSALSVARNLNQLHVSLAINNY